MSYSEDRLNDVFYEVREMKEQEAFDAQLLKMKEQDKHKYKRPHEMWEYALYRIKGGNSLENY